MRPPRGAPAAAKSRPLLNRQFVRFLLVGVVNSLFGYACFFGLLQAGLHYSAALGIATVLGVLFNFKSTGTVVFRSTNNGLLWRFIASYAVVYLLNLAGLGLLQRVGVSPQLAGAVLLLPAAVLSFVLNKKFVFTP
jgi:putative flippase GtrA